MAGREEKMTGREEGKNGREGRKNGREGGRNGREGGITYHYISRKQTPFMVNMAKFSTKPTTRVTFHLCLTNPPQEPSIVFHLHTYTHMHVHMHVHTRAHTHTHTIKYSITCIKVASSVLKITISTTTYRARNNKLILALMNLIFPPSSPSAFLQIKFVLHRTMTFQ